MTTFVNEKILEKTDSLPNGKFPDGQPHISFDCVPNSNTPLRCRIVTPEDLFKVGLAVEILKSHKCEINLEILYLMGSRMDRRISDKEPHTLKSVCDTINSWNVDSVRVFQPHSRSTIDLLKNYDEHYDCFAEESFYDMAAMKAMVYFGYGGIDCTLNSEMRNYLRASKISFVFPDEGAMKRYSKGILLKWWPNANLVVLSKDREERTGEIKGMKVVEGVPRDTCLIIDDLCDGGATFKGAAACLKSTAINVGLIVAHGIFSKGLPIEGIDWVGTTNSYTDENTHKANYFFKFVN